MTEPRKPRILLVSDSTYLDSGYGVYGREVMKRLHDSGLFELAELGCYGDYHDPRRLDIPWHFTSNLPNPSSEREKREYAGSTLNQFGEWRFERLCLDFRPDVVWAFRDWWLDEFLGRSPFRPFYHLALMPTVDTHPQREQWLASYLEADSVHTYTDWGASVLLEQGRGRVKLHGSAPPGADTEVFAPVANKEAYKRQMGLPEGALVVGMVARNQPRKLFPDLLRAFRRLLSEGPERLRKHAFLYLHTAHPDQACWDIPLLLKEEGVGHRVLFSYSCASCQNTYPHLWKDVVALCKNCKRRTSFLPNSSKGVDRQVLAMVYNLMDVYFQVVTNGGFEMPLVEAASCGVPVAGTDYSAPSDVVRKLGGTPLRVKALVRDNATGGHRAVPDGDDLVAQMIRLLSLPSPTRLTWGYRAREAVLAHYTYERTSRLWQEHFAALPLRPLEETWESPPRYHTPAPLLPETVKELADLSNDEFVSWGVSALSGRPDLLGSYMTFRMARDLDWGVWAGGMGGLAFNDASALGLGEEQQRVRYTREEAAKQLADIAHRQNRWERERTGS